MFNYSSMQEILHLPSAPTVLSVKTVPWFNGGKSGIQGLVEEVTKTAASCDVRVALCVCERDKTT